MYFTLHAMLDSGML